MNYFKRYKTFRDYIKTQLVNKEAEVLYVACEDKKGFIVLEVIFKKTKEKSKFLYKEHYWYTVPEMEQLARSERLHERLDSIREKWKQGFYEAIRLENSIHFITKDD